ncbi:serine/arginine repetitive matrix protein 1 [Trichoderma novae-zelandiae]
MRRDHPYRPDYSAGTVRVEGMANCGRYDDGEVVRYGAGESWRPTPRERSPRRPRSPVRDRARSPPRTRSPRPRSPIIPGSDSYVPGRYPPRRRSRSIGDRYRRERSRDRESPRRRERSRSPIRRSPLPRRSPLRRESPARENRYERPRSPRRDWERDRPRDLDRDRDRDWDRERNERPRVRDWERDTERRDERRSRSPFSRDRRRERSPPPGKTTPIAARGAAYRPRSRSPNRRDDRFQPFKRQSPPRDLGPTTIIPSRPASERADSQSQSAKTRSPLTLEGSPTHAAAAAATPSTAAKDTQRSTVHEPASGPSKSPPRGPAALRAPPSGPAAARASSTAATMPAPQPQKIPQTPSAAPHRPDATSPTIPPSGPRGYVPSNRGSSFASRGGRGGWNQPSSRHLSGQAVSATPSGPSNIPTGPRAASSAAAGTGPASAQRPFNPPTGPSAQHGNGPRHSLAQSLLATMPPLIPGGKADPSMTPMLLGVTKEIEPHYRKLRDEEEKIREELRMKQERLRRSLYAWNRLERDARAWEMRSDLSEKSMKNLAGEGAGGAAF